MPEYFLPNCSGVDDTAAFQAVITAIGSNKATIRLPYLAGSRCAVTSLSIPANITIDNTDGTGISRSGTLTIAGPIVNPPGKQLFYGAGTTVFTGNTSLPVLSPDWWGTARDGVTNDATAINAAFTAAKALAVAGQGVTVQFTPNANYKINSTCVIEATVDILARLTLSGYGTTITVNTTATPGFQIKNVTAGKAFDNWIIEGLRFMGIGTESECVAVTNAGTAYCTHWQINDVIVQGSAGHGIHIDNSASNNGYGAFEWSMRNPVVDLGVANVTKNGIFLDGSPGTISSPDIYNPTTAHGLHGIYAGAASLHLYGGTVLSAYEEGILAIVNSGLISGTHVEGNWTSAGVGLGGGEIYLEGWCDVIGLEMSIFTTTKAAFGIDTYNYGGPLNIIGMRTLEAGKYVRVRKALTDGVVNLIGIGPSQVDATAVDDINNPTINYIGGINGGPALQTQGGMIFSNTGLTLPNVGKLRIAPKTDQTYSGAMTIDVTISNHVIAAVSGTSATVTMTPSAAGSAGDWLYITTEADASGTVTATFAATFHSSGTQVTTASHFSTIAFQSDGTRWVEMYRTTNLA